jgi:hypothetical protein
MADDKSQRSNILFPAAATLVQADAFTFPCFASAPSAASDVKSERSADTGQDWLKCSSFAGSSDTGGHCWNSVFMTQPFCCFIVAHSNFRFSLVMIPIARYYFVVKARKNVKSEFC